MAKIYSYANAENFLDVFEAFLIEKFSENLDKTIILMPSGYEVSKLQYSLGQNFTEAKILPKILPFYEIVKNFSSALTRSSNLSERFLLVDILAKRQKEHSYIKEIGTASSLHSLLNEFIARGLSPSDVAKLKEPFESEGWQEIQAELCDIYKVFLAMLDKHNIVSQSKINSESIINLFSLIAKQQEYHLIICPGLLYDQSIKEIINLSLKRDNCSIVMQYAENLQGYNKAKANPVYSLLPENTKIEALEKADINSFAEFIDADIKQSSPLSKHSNILTIIEAKTIYDEAKIIADTLIERKELDGDIAICINNADIKHIFTAALKKNEIDFNDQIGTPLDRSNVFSLFKQIYDIHSNKFSLVKLIELVQHPYLMQIEDSKNAICELQANAESICSLEDCLNYIDNPEHEQYKIIAILAKEIEFQGAANYLHHLLALLEQIVTTLPTIEENCYSKLVEVIDIIDNSLGLSIQRQDVGAIIDKFIGKQLVMMPYDGARVTIISPTQLTTQKYSLVVMVNVSDSALPVMLKNSPWLGMSAIEDLGLYINDSYQRQLYVFYLLLQRKRVVLSFAKQDHLGQASSASQFIEKLKFIDVDRRIKWVNKEDVSGQKAPITTEKRQGKSGVFPARISASSIEVLLKSPYNFYANKILGLKKIDEITNEFDLAKYGSILHEVLEVYTKEYQKNTPDKISIFADICARIIRRHVKDEYKQYALRQKMLAVAPEFISFDEVRRAGGARVLAEIGGCVKLEIAGRAVEVTAIADRLEVYPNGELIILDYKTGTPPSITEVRSGMAPQLVIEALIASRGGFANLKAAPSCKIVFVKISASEPRITTTELVLSEEDINKHLRALIELLTFYIKEGSYDSEHMINRFDDYSHLARRSKA